MTKEEIKGSVSMKEVIQRYGLPEPNKAGFISCPFHKGDRQPSMRIYDQDYHCFACGENGDIFTFVQRMEDISFKEAFLSLGGDLPRTGRTSLQPAPAGVPAAETERSRRTKEGAGTLGKAAAYSSDK